MEPSEGNEGTVTLTVLNFGDPQLVEVPAGSTVHEALQAAGVDVEASVRFRGESLSINERTEIGVLNGEAIVVSPPPVDHGK